MSSITTINSGDLISGSRTDINTNFSNLNTDKIETSTLDTDTTLAANSDSKIATQKAVKTYVDTQGGANASTSVRGIVELATAAEITAGTSTGATGAALVVTPDQLKLSSIPVVTVLTTTSTSIGSSTTQFDITNPSGTTFRYTYDGTGTDPSISSANNPVGSLVSIVGGNFAVGNQGVFVVTASGTNYFEVTNASGVVESNKTISTGTFHRQNSQFSKTTGAKYAVIEVQGSGANGDSVTTDEGGGGGGGGGYSKKTIASSSLASSEPYIIAPGNSNTTNVLNTQFGTYAKATSAICASLNTGSAGGTGTLGDLNISGGKGDDGFGNGGINIQCVGGRGGDSMLGRGGGSNEGESNGNTGGNYGGGGSGASNDTGSGSYTGGAGAQGVIIITEYFT